MRIAVVLLRLPGSTAEPVSKAAVQASMFGATNSVANWYSQMSGGQVAVTGTVYGYFAGVSSCDLATQTAAAAAAKSGYVAADYDNLVVYTPDQSCDFSGMGWIGASGVFLNGTVTQGVMEHELGHNLGLLHAGAYACGVAALSPGCLIDYGDPTDVMGDPTLNRGFSAEHKYMLGWIPASEVRTVTTGTADDRADRIGESARCRFDRVDPRARRRRHVVRDRPARVGRVRRRPVGRVDPPGRVGEHRRHRAGQEPRVGPGSDVHRRAHKVTIKTLTDSGHDRVGARVHRPVRAHGRRPEPDRRGRIRAQHRDGIEDRAGQREHQIDCGRGSRRRRRSHGDRLDVRQQRRRRRLVRRQPRQRLRRQRQQRGRATLDRLFGARTALPPGATITIRYPAFSGATVSSANDFSGSGRRAPTGRVRARRTTARSTRTRRYDAPPARSCSAWRCIGEPRGSHRVRATSRSARWLPPGAAADDDHPRVQGRSASGGVPSSAGR